MNIQLLRKLATEDRIALKRHMVLRMHQREIKVDEVKEVLISSQIVEEYATDKPLPSTLVLGYTSKKRPLHVVVAIEENEKLVWTITAYEPTMDEWEKGFHKRRKK